MATVTIHDSGDWVVISSNDKIIYQGHRPNINQFARILERLGYAVTLTLDTDEE